MIHNNISDTAIVLHDTLSERIVISSILSGIDTYLPRHRDAGITDNHFVDTYSRRIWRDLSESYDCGFGSESLDFENRIITRPTSSEAEYAESRDYSATIADIRSIACPEERVDQSVRRVSELYTKRETFKRIDDLRAGLGDKSPEQIADELKFITDQIQTAATSAPVKLPEPRLFQDIEGDPSVRQETMIDGLLKAASSVMVSASSKAGKTWSLLDLAYAFANGTEWLGRKCKKVRTLFVNFELQEDTLRERINLMNLGFGVSPMLWTLRGYDVDWASISLYIEDYNKDNPDDPIMAVVLDPIYMMLGDANENDNSEVAAMLRQVGRLMMKTGGCLAYSHHHSKGSKNAQAMMDRNSGAGAWARHADAIIDFLPHELEDHYIVECEVRAFKKPETKVFWKNHSFRFEETDEDASQQRKAGAPAKVTDSAYLEMMKDHPLGLKPGAWDELAGNYFGAGLTTVKTIRLSLVKEGKIITDNKLQKIA